jgi:hypothetical protein
MATSVGALGLVVAVCGFAATESDSSAIEFGGLRQARATLSVTGSDYLIKVRMLPVRSFDVGTNTRLNREKGRELALQALAKYLSGKTPAEIAVTGAQVKQAGLDGEFYALVLRVPREGVSLISEAGSRPQQGHERVTFDSELFTRKRDYLNTLEKLASMLSTNLKSVASEKDSFAVAIAEIEERGTINFEKLGKEISADLLLLSVEQQELNEAVAKHQDRLLEQLKVAVKKHESEEKRQ